MDKSLDVKLRRWAQRLGLTLRKGRARRVRADNAGWYQLRDLEQDRILAGPKFELTPTDVEQELSRRERQLVESRM